MEHNFEIGNFDLVCRQASKFHIIAKHEIEKNEMI